MTSPDIGPAVEWKAVRCPRCGGVLEGVDSVRKCEACGKTASVTFFQPLVEAPAAAPGAGRCAHHPNKDAVASCSRCGSFVCDVCLTRTGEQSLCPACFDTMHSRDALDTTRARRVRWDYIVFHAGLLSTFCWLGVIAVPFSIGAGIYALRRRRKDPWMSLWRIVAGISLASATVLGWLVFLAFIYARKS